MKLILLSTMLIISSLCIGQTMSVRWSQEAQGIGMQIPVNTASKGSLLVIAYKHADTKVISVQYVEDLIKYKSFSIYTGAGLFTSVRNVLNYKQDGNTIFLAGITGILGVKYNITPNINISTDINPRVDFPAFGGCHMHKHCDEQYFGGINLSLGVKL